ncbi:hypothetical protein ACQ4PT_012600 [Festuca glaucescens]
MAATVRWQRGLASSFSSPIAKPSSSSRRTAPEEEQLVAGRAAEVGRAVQPRRRHCAPYPRREQKLGPGGSSAALSYLQRRAPCRHLKEQRRSGGISSWLPRAWDSIVHKKDTHSYCSMTGPEEEVFALQFKWTLIRYTMLFSVGVQGGLFLISSHAKNEFHGMFYHPSNARIWFYGDDDTKERLQILSEYLDLFEASPTCNESKVMPKKLFKESVRITEKYPGGQEGDLKKKYMPDPEKASRDEAAEKEILKQVKSSMTPEDLAELARATKELKDKQETPDPPELSKLFLAYH